MKKQCKDIFNNISKGTGLIEHYFERYIVCYLIVFFKFNINPNIITLFSLIYASFAAYLIYIGHPIIGSILYFFFSIPDLLDGTVARLYNRKSKFGAFFDGFTDSLSEVIVLIAIGFYSKQIIFFLFIVIFKILFDYASIRIKWIYQSNKRQENFLDYLHNLNLINFVKFSIISLTRNDTRKLFIVFGFVLGSIALIEYYFIFLYSIAFFNLILVIINERK